MVQRTRLSDFNFHLPPELLAEHPAPTRDGSRLMVIHRESGRIEHRSFPDIQSYFGAGDCLVLNNTQVVPARMEVRKNRMDGALIELLLIEEVAGEPHTWNVLLDPLKKLRLGHRLVFGNNELKAEIVAEAGERERHIRFFFEGSSDELRGQLYQLGCT
ncbi:MAG: tRNA preQ1(34) S-adenosylmethionine ribosyltransferase-isomerase QueA, partial [Cryomorphaceae bacterium]